LLAATTAMDYSYALFGLATGLWLLVHRRPWPAAVLLACSAGARLQFAPLAVFALGFWIVSDRTSRRETSLAVPLFALLCGLLYLPVSITHHLTLGFLRVSESETRTLLDHLSRFVYKASLLVGHVATLTIAVLVVGFLVAAVRGRARTELWRRPETLLAAGLAAVNLAVFLRYPLSVSYLIPLVFTLPFLLAALKAPPGALALVAVLQVSYWFVSPDLLKITHLHPEGPGRPVIATGARLSPHLEPGVIRADLERRQLFQEYYLRSYLIAEPREFWRHRDEYSPHRHEVVGVRHRLARPAPAENP
jgi:hypothetical protein